MNEANFGQKGPAHVNDENKTLKNNFNNKPNINRNFHELFYEKDEIQDDDLIQKIIIRFKDYLDFCDQEIKVI